MSGTEPWERAKTLLLIAWIAAILANAIEAVLDPNGTLWSLVRYTSSIAFVAALVYWLLAAVRHRRLRAQSPPHERQTQG